MSESGEPKKISVSMPEAVREWLDSDDPSKREFIVVADLPKRTVDVESTKGRTRFTNIRGLDPGQREERLAELLVKIKKIVPCDQARLLKAAGAVAINALPEQIRKVATLSGVREIQLNVRRR